MRLYAYARRTLDRKVQRIALDAPVLHEVDWNATVGVVAPALPYCRVPYLIMIPGGPHPEQPVAIVPA